MVDTCVAYPRLAGYFTPVPSTFSEINLTFRALKYRSRGCAMTEKIGPEKPEWFALADGDAPSAQVRKVSKKLPALAVLVTGAVIATGAFFANASEQEDGEKLIGNTSFNQVDNTQGVSPDVTAPNQNNSNNSNGVHPAPPKGVNPPSGGIQDPSKGGVMPPQERGDDDGDHEWGEGGEHEDEGREGHEGRERGEHGQRGKAPTIPSTTSSKSA